MQEESTSFKWDSANARWKRVAADKDTGGKYSTEKWIEGGGSTIKTRTGGEYTVSPTPTAVASCWASKSQHCLPVHHRSPQL